MRKNFYKSLAERFKKDKNIVVLLGDIGVYSFKSAFEFDSTRIYNMGILEQSMLSVAAGLSSRGFIPFVHSIAPFVTERCFEQLKLDIGYENRNVIVASVGNSYDYSALGVTHHCPNDLNIIQSIPNFRVFCPGNSNDVERILNDHLYSPYPKYIRLSEYENNLKLPYEDLSVLQRHSNGLIVVVGNSIRNFDTLLKSEIKATIVYTWNISQFDVNKIKTILNDGDSSVKTCITVIEPSYPAGIIQKICLNVNNIHSINSIAVPPAFIDHYGVKSEIDKSLGLDDESIIQRLKLIYR